MLRVARDFWKNSGEDDVTFLAGGLAFNILLAGVPFVLLLAGTLGYLLGDSVDTTTGIVRDVVAHALPQSARRGAVLDPIFADVVRTRAAFGITGAIGFLWFSARLFASLRSVMTTVFAHGRDRTVLRGMLWDLHLTVITLVLMVAWIGISAVLAVSSGRVSEVLIARGIRVEVMSGLEVMLGRLAALALVVGIFVALYRWLPVRKTSWQGAVGGGIAAALFFELARGVFGFVVTAFPPATLYTGTLGALVTVVFWTYYAALVFVLGAEVASAIQDAHSQHSPP